MHAPRSPDLDAKASSLPQHVIVDVTNSWAGGEALGILIAWRRDFRGAWHGWVIDACAYSTGEGLEVEVKQHWVAAHLIRPIGGPRRSAGGS